MAKTLKMLSIAIISSHLSNQGGENASKRPPSQEITPLKKVLAFINDDGLIVLICKSNIYVIFISYHALSYFGPKSVKLRWDAFKM